MRYEIIIQVHTPNLIKVNLGKSESHFESVRNTKYRLETFINFHHQSVGLPLMSANYCFLRHAGRAYFKKKPAIKQQKQVEFTSFQKA